MLAWALAVAPAATAVPVDRVQESFTLVRQSEAAGRTVSTFRVGGLCCAALADSRGGIRYIFLAPPRKPADAAGKARFQEEAAALHAYVASLSESPGQVRLVPFASSTAAVIVLTPTERKSAFPGCVLGEGVHSVIGSAMNMGGVFESLEAGEITIVLPAQENAKERCAIVLPLAKPKVDLLGFSPPPSHGKKEDLALASIVSNLRIARQAMDSKADAETLRAAAKQVGGSRCLAKGSEYAVILFNKKLFVGPLPALKRYVRDRKKSTAGDYWGIIKFPEEADTLPTPGQGEAPGGAGPFSVQAVCRFFGYEQPTVQGDCAYILLQGCRVAIPLPDAPTPEQRLAAPAKYIFVRSTDDSGQSSSQYAGALQDMLEAQDALADPQEGADGPADAGTGVITFASASTVPEERARQAVQALQAEAFPLQEAKPWPGLSRTGAEPTQRVRSLLESRNQSQADIPSAATPASEALEAYLRFLKGLENP